MQSLKTDGLVAKQNDGDLEANLFIEALKTKKQREAHKASLPNMPTVRSRLSHWHQPCYITEKGETGSDVGGGAASEQEDKDVSDNTSVADDNGEARKSALLAIAAGSDMVSSDEFEVT